MNPQDQVTIEYSPLYLPLDDTNLLALLNDAEQRANSEYAKKKIKERSENNEEFWLGHQVDENQLDQRYQMAHVDNVAFEGLENQIKLASGSMPDIFCAPPDEQQYNIEAARDMQQWIRERIDNNTIKRLIKNGLRKMNLDLMAVIKPRWDYSRGDFCFELIDTKHIRFFEGAKVLEDGYTIDGVDGVIHYVEEPTTVVLAKFKKKDAELRAEIGTVTKRADLPSRIRYSEVHFRWFDTMGRMNEGVAWRYGNVILASMRNPYYDYDNPGVNYFDRPRKPFILFSYLNLGDTVYEATTAFEQAKPANKIINKRRRQITEISDRAVPKMAFNGGALTAEQARNISPSPNEGILLNQEVDDIRKALFIIPATPPNPILYNDMIDLRGRVNSMFATNGTSTAADSASASGISKQISREGDLVTSDDIVDVVVERVVSEMAGWAMQFARLFYDDDRPPMRITNEESETKFVELDRQKIETDIQVQVKASTNDKATRRADAIQQLSGKITDPYTFFEDIEAPNPKERTKRLMSFITSQTSGDWSGYLDLIGVSLEEKRADEEDAQRDIELIIQGGDPSVHDHPSEAYVSTLMAFVQDPAGQYAALDPGAKQRFQGFIQKLRAQVQKIAAQQGGGEQPPQPQGIEGALQGAPGVAPPQPGYGPQVDPSTQWAPQQNPNMASIQQRVQVPPTTATQPGVVTR